MQATQVYDFTLQAGGSCQLPVSGEYYRIVSAAGPLSIKEDAGGTFGPLLAGQGMRNRKFTWLTLVDKSGAQNTGQIIVAGSDFIDDRIAGDVSVVRNPRTATAAGRAFMACGIAQGDDAAHVIQQLQFWNPAGSGKTVIVTSLRFETFGKGAIATIESGPVGAQVNAGRSKRGGAQSGVLQVLAGYTSGAPSSAGALIGGASLFEQFDDAISLQPGTGIVIKPFDEYTTLVATAEYFEE